jgi:signal transduction histidine kinase
MQHDGGDLQLNRQWVDIDTLVKGCVELMQITAAKKNQHISVTLLGKRRAIMVDTEKIRRVIGNIISNAIKFSNEGREIKVRIEEKAESFQITIEDHGIGIPAKNKDKVFDLFTTARRTGTKGESSYGLGLSICKQIMQAHGGKICFTSEQNKGTTFYLEIDKM